MNDEINTPKRGPGRPTTKNILNPDGSIKRSYRKYDSMHARCERPSHPAYQHYARKGIKVCARWSGRDGYTNFVADMGEPPEGLTLDRINNDGNYEPGNCCWATWKEQAKNRKQRKAKPDSVTAKARAAGISRMLVYQRKRAQWPESMWYWAPVSPRSSRVALREELERRWAEEREKRRQSP